MGPDTRFTLVLGGGGMKGLAHVGVLQALEEHGRRPSAIVGSSVGALVGAAWAAGLSVSRLRDLAIALRRKDVFVVAHADMAFKRMRGVASGTEDLLLRFAPGLDLRGQLDSAGGYAPGSGSVEVLSDDAHGYADVDRSGAFVIRGLPPGTYEVTAWGAAAGGGPALSGTVRVEAGAGNVRVELAEVSR